MQVEKPTAIARYALNVETEELTPDFYENYIKTQRLKQRTKTQ
jgi:hypothetical protein